MSQPQARRVVLLGPTTITTSAAFPDINIPQGFSSATIAVTAATTSGTSPTFVVFIQQQIPQCGATDTAPGPPTGTVIWDDILALTTITTNSTSMAKLGSQFIPSATANATTMTTASWTQSDAALTAGSLRLGPIGGDWRVKVTAGGTSPSTVLSVTAEFLPYGG